MKVFVIQPNYSANSEVWLQRMNSMLQPYICGMATFLQNENIDEKYSVFNLNGRRPGRSERWLIRLGIKKYDSQKIMRKELYETITKNSTDVLIIHFATTASYLWDVLSKLTLPIYIYVHGYDIIWDHTDMYGNRTHSEKYRQNILDISNNINVKFITASHCSTENLLSIGIEKSKIKTKIFGVDLPEINQAYDKEELTILFLGRFEDFKGPDIVLSAYLLACDMGFKGQLVMAGDGPLRIMCELISRRSKYSERISFVGVVDRKKAAELFEEADIYSMHNCKGLLSNAYDTFGVTIIEAMSYGLPSVTASVGGPSEIIDNGVDGLIVEPDNSYEHAMAFMRLWKNPELRGKLSNNARSKILHKYNSAIEKKELFEILQIDNPS